MEMGKALKHFPAPLCAKAFERLDDFRICKHATFIIASDKETSMMTGHIGNERKMASTSSELILFDLLSNYHRK